MNKLQLTTNGADETIGLGRKIGERLRGGEIIRLIGDVGAGKTTLVRGLARGIGSPDHVSSPTFTVHKLYKGRLKLYHYDFYRVGADVAVASELSEIMSEPNTAVVLEWPQQAKLSLPKDPLDISIRTTSEHGRQFEVTIPPHNSYIKVS